MVGCGWTRVGSERRDGDQEPEDSTTLRFGASCHINTIGRFNDLVSFRSRRITQRISTGSLQVL